MRRALLAVLMGAPLVVVTGGLLGALLLAKDGYSRGLSAAGVLVVALLALGSLLAVARAAVAAIPARGVPGQAETLRRLSLGEPAAAPVETRWRRLRLAALAGLLAGQAAVGALALRVAAPGWVIALVIALFAAAAAAMARIVGRAAAEEARELDRLGLSATQDMPAHRDQVRPVRDRSGRRRWPMDTVYTGVRHGRAVTIRLFAEGASLVRVAQLTPAPTLCAPGGRRLHAALAAFPALAAAAAALPESAQWEGCEVSTGPAGVEITRGRRGRGARFWLYDLWLAERLAAAVDCAG